MDAWALSVLSDSCLNLLHELDVCKDVIFEICETLSCCYLQLILCLNVFNQIRIDISDGVIQDVILKTGSKDLICLLCGIVVVLY